MRRYKFTRETRDLIVQAIAAGVYPYVAAEAAGITRVTFWRWMKAGEEAEERLEELRETKIGELRRRAKELGLTTEPRAKKDDLVALLGSAWIDLQGFREDVMRATALARAKAEAKVLETRPYEWLTRGPGRGDWAPEVKDPNEPLDAPTESEEPELTEPEPGFAAEVLRVLADAGVLPNVVPIGKDEEAGNGEGVDRGGVSRGSSGAT